jgi:oligoribonuclease
MAQDSTHLIWIDLEMSGLRPEADTILELALVVTTQNLQVVAEGPVRAVHQSDAVLDGMDNWNKATHARSGLIDRVRASTLNEVEVEDEVLAFVSQHVPPGVSPMCGNSICQDRRFLARCMPRLEEYFHYRNLDVSTLKELARRWKPEVLAGFTKQSKHEALADIYESIEELKYYRGTILKI